MGPRDSDTSLVGLGTVFSGKPLSQNDQVEST